jgi:hypothetical protein
MTNLIIPIENAFLMVTQVESRDGAIVFELDVSAHILRNIGGTKVSVYVHDKREQISQLTA